jgi:hypothetical protein
MFLGDSPKEGRDAGRLSRRRIIFRNLSQENYDSIN